MGTRELQSAIFNLQSTIKGEVLFDDLSRTIYATDASIYEITPLGVVLPKDVDDVLTVIEQCRLSGTSIIPRGAGTGLTGGAVGPGVVVDLSRYMNRIGHLDLNARTVEVEPGVVLDELNAHLAPHALQFAPDVATGSRATIGGMIANNSCGVHSIVYGRTVDHVLELTVALADGEVVTFGVSTARVAQIEGDLSGIRDDCYGEIERRFPRISRSNGGYGLDRLGPPGTTADAIKILCGSEGTLGIVVRAKLKLIPIPGRSGLVVLHFDNVLDALGATTAVLRHGPTAVELIDRPILDAGRNSAVPGRRCDFLQGDPSALLTVEFRDDDAAALASRIDALAGDLDALRGCLGASKVLEPDRQANVWNLRKAGLGLLMSRPGDAQPHTFVEDSAVDPSRLREYIERFSAILQAEGVEASYYAHAGVGCIHVRPVLNLKKADDIERMERIAGAVSDLALEFGGAVTGEHGDGIIRSCWIEKMYGPTIASAFKQVKRLFDPHGLFNPHKIVDPWPMTGHLRYGPSVTSRSVKTYLDFSAHGGMAGLAGMCSGIGECRQRLERTMCPSYVATSDEQHTTRARANALRVALSNRGLLDGLDDPQLAEVMDLCISCKACKTECPTGVDMARLKSEYLCHQNLAAGVSARARLIADMPRLLSIASWLPRLSNLLGQSKTVRAVIERRYGLDRRFPPPILARQTFRAWLRRHRKAQKARWPTCSVPRPSGSGRGRVVYFVDTWMNFFTPQVGIASVKLLERAGFDVHCPQTLCCGRPAISQGLLAEAKQLAEFNVGKLVRFASAGVPILGSEPSCILTLVDEYPQLLRSPAARMVASQTMMIESFLQRLLADEPAALPNVECRMSNVDCRHPIDIRHSAFDNSLLLYHPHCHQKAIVGSADAVALLRCVWGNAASEIDGGCCGMAGSFGHEREHYELARAIGEQRLFPAIADCGLPTVNSQSAIRNPQSRCASGTHTQVAVSGFSCRQHIEHHTGVRPRHLVEYLADAIGD